MCYCARFNASTRKAAFVTCLSARTLLARSHNATCVADDHVELKKGYATPNASHGASTRIGRGSDCSPWTSAGDNALLKDVKKSSCVDVPCAVSEFEEYERTPSITGEACLAAQASRSDSGQQPRAAHTPQPVASGCETRCDEERDKAHQRGSYDGGASPHSGADDETTRRLAQQIEEWGREETGPDIVALAKAYVGIQKMAEEVRCQWLLSHHLQHNSHWTPVHTLLSMRGTPGLFRVLYFIMFLSRVEGVLTHVGALQEALNHRFNMIKHDAIRLRPEAAHVFLSLQRNDFEDLDDMPVPRHGTQ